MKTRMPAHGYTVVEVLIFLAVTSFLFVAVVATLGAQQRRTEFALAAREFDSQIQDIMNDVSTGYYYNTANIACAVTGGGNVSLTTAVSDQQGSNADVVAELRALREQNARLEARLASIEKSTGQFAEQFDNVSAGGNEIPVLIVNQTLSAEVVA